MQYTARQLSWAAAYPAAEDWILSGEDGEHAGRMLFARTGNGEAPGTGHSRSVAGSFRVVDIAVLPGFQRQGIARAALRQAQAWAWETGADLGLRVSRNNTAAQHLYRSLGFLPAGADEIALEMTWHAARPQEAA